MIGFKLTMVQNCSHLELHFGSSITAGTVILAEVFHTCLVAFLVFSIPAIPQSKPKPWQAHKSLISPVEMEVRGKKKKSLQNIERGDLKRWYRNIVWCTEVWISLSHTLRTLDWQSKPVERTSCDCTSFSFFLFFFLFFFFFGPSPACVSSQDRGKKESCLNLVDSTECVNWQVFHCLPKSAVWIFCHRKICLK